MPPPPTLPKGHPPSTRPHRRPRGPRQGPRKFLRQRSWQFYAWSCLGCWTVVQFVGIAWFFESFLSSSDQLLDPLISIWETYVDPVWDVLEAGVSPSRRARIRPFPLPEIQRLLEEPPALKLPKPIINVGFPKAGTSSLFSFFHCNGLNGQHWYCCEPQNHPSATTSRKLMSRCILQNIIYNHRNQTHPTRGILEGCGDYDFYSEINGPRYFRETQFRTLKDHGKVETRANSVRYPRLIFPQHHYLDALHQQFPNATFILNTRPAQEWLESVWKWRSNLPWEIPNEFWFQDRERNMNTTIDPDRWKMTSSPEQWNQTLLKIWDYHHEFVKQFVEKHPSHTLLTVDITDPQAGTFLAEAFGVREECWGHFNENNKTRGGARMKGPTPLERRRPRVNVKRQRTKTERGRQNRKPSLFHRNEFALEKEQT